MILSQCTDYPRLAVLMTCFNRKEKTLCCLQSLQAISECVEVFLVDDKSTDGTADAIRQQFPSVHLIAGCGSLFWNRGMHLAWQTALAGDYDFYLWLNDDVKLYSDAIRDLLKDCEETKNQAVLAGATKAPDSETVTYGGISIANGKLALPDGTLQPIRNPSGNVVLIPRAVVQKIGILDPVFQHHFGDVDYGMSAAENGIGLFLAKHFAGECAANPISRIRKNGVSLKRRFQALYSPLGTRPDSVFYLFWKHGKHLKAVIFIFYLWAINLMPDVFYHKLFKK